MKVSRFRPHLLAIAIVGSMLTLALPLVMSDQASATAISTIQFAGLTWNVSGYGDFANTAEQVWVDGDGYLHLKVSNVSGSWKDVEVVSQSAMGLGTYTWTTQGVPELDKNMVLGMFPYLDDAHEVDQELSRWGDEANYNMAFTIQPDSAIVDAFELPTTSADTAFVTQWQADRISFSVTEGSTVERTFSSNVERDAAGVHAIINLWQFEGAAPSDGQPVEIVIKGFSFASPSTVITSTPIEATDIFIPSSDGLAVTYDFSFTGTPTLLDEVTWDFGDGTTSHEPSPTHTYAGAGEYTVTLTVQDRNGEVSALTEEFTIGQPSIDGIPVIGSIGQELALVMLVGGLVAAGASTVLVRVKSRSITVAGFAVGAVVAYSFYTGGFL